MKKTLFTFGLLFIGIIYTNASGVIPKDIETAFQKKFPHAANVVWVCTTQGTFEADYSCLNHHFHTFLDERGNIIENDLVIQYNSLPDQAHYYVTNHLKGIAVSEVIAPQTANDQDHFILKGKLDGTNYTLHFRSDGVLTKLETLSF